MLALDFLSDKTHLGAIVALVVVRVDRLTVEGLTDRLDVLLHANVGEQTTRGDGSLRRTRERTGAGRNVREELRSLERKRLLLQELVVESLQASLSGLLLGLTRSQLSLSTLQSSALSACAEGCQLLSRACAHAVEALTQLLSSLSGGKILSKVLLSKSSLLLRGAKALCI